MDYIALGTRYYRDPAILAANKRTGGQAELLFLRALAQCGADEAEGHIPEEALSFLGVRNAAKVADVLVDEGLWLRNGTGWYVRSWEKWQSEHDILARRRKSERERKRAERLRRAAEEDPPEPPESRDGSRDLSRDGPRTRPPMSRGTRARDRDGSSVVTKPGISPEQRARRSTTDERVEQALAVGREVQALVDNGWLDQPQLRALPGGAS